MTDFDRSLAIIIGIDRYQGGISELQTAVSDAIAVSELLRQDHDYDVTLLLDADATQEHLTLLLEEALPQTVRAGDRDLCSR